MIADYDRIENIVGKGENAGYQHFLLVTSIFSFSHNVFKMFLSQGCEKSGLCGKELNLYQTMSTFKCI